VKIKMIQMLQLKMLMKLFSNWMLNVELSFKSFKIAIKIEKADLF
jgi:hypothetical protein